MGTVKDMVEALGGSRRVAGALSTTQQAVCNMMARNRMHPRYWRALVADAKRHQVRGINIDALLDMAEGSNGEA